jgi:two-component system chemotaxis sensor kinase CheA
MSNKMNERELVNLIFQAGFSTAAKVTNVSGRGVGMDVVKTNIEKIGGTVDVSSNLGSGTTFKIKIPLTLAIIPALIVTCKEERYAIPQVSLLELVRLDAGQVAEKIEMLHGAPVYRLRGNLLPLVYLSNELYPGSIDQASVLERNIDTAFNIVVLQADDRQFGLVVDKITDSQEIVVKPLGKQLQGITVFAGATIMGDGHVALILDILGIAQQSNVVSEVHDTANIEAVAKATSVRPTNKPCSYARVLVVDDWPSRSPLLRDLKNSITRMSKLPVRKRLFNIAVRLCRLLDFPTCSRPARPLAI